MYKKLYYIICLVLFSFVSFSQGSLKGKVLNEATNEPLAGASIYFNNTSYGTTTSQSGEFTLFIPDVFNPELIISSIGFEIIVFKISANEDLNKKYVFKLVAKEALMADVLVLPDATRKRYLRIFNDNFLGLTAEAASSNIKNTGSIYFTKTPGENKSFNAHCDTPLIITNRMLGYKIHFELQQFYYNEQTGATSFYGFTRYEETGDKKRWIKNRRRAYYGSTMHFFRSLINDRLEQEAYKIFVVRTDTVRSTFGKVKKMDIAIPVTAAQIVQKDSLNPGLFVARWNTKLMVQYNKQPASKSYLSKRTFVDGSLPNGFRAYLLLNDEAVQIDSKGILLNPMSIFYSGYWIYEKAANLLPYDYDPGKD